MDFLRRATTPAVTSVAGLFGLFSSDLLQPTQEEVEVEEKDYNKIKKLAEKVDAVRAAAQGPSATPDATLAAINENLELDNALNKKPSDEVNAANLKIENDKLMQASLQAFIAAQGDITTFRKQCVDEAVSQFQEALDAYKIPVTPDLSSAVMKQIAVSWSEFIISSTTPDSSIYLSYKTFFFRVNQAIDALLTQCIFLSTKYPPPLPSPPPPPDFKSYPKVKVGPCWYVVGPILDFQNIEGRIFIYVKCYRTEECTDGIYFWVYGSQSEGFNRVFFKLDPFGSIEKGFDYTQGTFVHLPLQMALCNYYKTHRSNPPELLDTLKKLNSFMSSMPYLQQDSIKSVCHRYMIDYSFRFIIRKGFPLHQPNMSDSDWLGVVNMYCIKQKVNFKIESERIIQALKVEWQTQRDTYFPENEGDPVNPNYRLNYEFSRRKMGYGTTCPYIFCFTTCGLVQSCPMFKLFLSANSYKNTFWCQGFQNYTEILSIPSNRKILSPVLHVVIGALLQDPDMRLSTLRNIILNIGIMSDARTISQEYNEATKAFMTVGTEKFGDPGTSLYLPNIPIRSAALLAFKKIRNKTNEIYESFKKKNSSPSEEDKKIVHLEVQKKIIMIKILAARLLGEPPPLRPPPLPPLPPANMILFSQEMQNLCSVKMDKYNVAIQTAATESTITAFRTSISTSDVNVFTSEEYYTDAQTNATAFIEASPEAAAAALFGYISSPKKHNEPTEFEKHLTHFALLCLKKEWIRGIMDDAYHALQGVFNRENAIYNYFGKDGKFYQFDPAAPSPADPYVLISSFDEVRKEDTSPTNPDPNELNVTVVTFAHIYRVDCGYHEVFADGTDVFKSMSIIYQISTTVVYTRVYTREVNPRILYAVTHRTPLVCLPDLPDARRNLIAALKTVRPPEKVTAGGVKRGRPREISKETQQLIDAAKQAAEQAKKKAPSKKFIAEQNLFIEERDHPLTSPYTLLATYKRVASYGALFAGKMMEYFFGGENGYYQLPYFFKNFDKFLKVCHQYDSTALMYLPDVPPYDLLVHHPSALELLPQSIESYFTTLGINFNGLVSGVDHKTYIQTKLNEYGRHIQAISEYLTKDFMPKPIDSDPDSFPSVSTASSMSSTQSRRDEDLKKLLPYFGYIDENIKYLNSILFGLPLPEEDDSDRDWSPISKSSRSDYDESSLDGGTLPIKNRIKKSITTRKNKNKNKPRTKSKTPARRITIRIKRLIKSKVTKPKTYKRRATGGKRKSKPNKTMRRYRRVRK